MSTRFVNYEEAFNYAIDYANQVHHDIAIRKVKEYGKTGFNVSIASKNDSDYARAEIVKPGTPKSKRNPGKAFTYHGSFQSLILARRKEREIPGSFIEKRGGRYYILKPKWIGTKRNLTRKNPGRGTVIYGRVLKIFAQKTSGPYKGQRFVHAFKAGAVMLGLANGDLLIKHP